MPKPAPVKKAPSSSPAERLAKHEATPTVAAPKDLPKAWRGLLKGARLVGARHEVRSRSDGKPAFRSVSLELRYFGVDDEVMAGLRKALEGLKLPGMPTQGVEAEVREGPVAWKTDVRRRKAPAGEARQTLVTVEWRRAHPDPAEARECRRPPPLNAPPELPRWLSRATLNNTTRRRISVATSATAEAQEVHLRLSFRNGFAQDGFVGRLSKAAQKAGLKKRSGSGTRQVWAGPKGRLQWAPYNRKDLHLGCAPWGPIVSVEWRAE